jgi:carbamoyl-phosphate synthase large subunit
VKEAVLPFKRFLTHDGLVVDSVLGPEMRSTGEVMGIDDDFGTAFAKSQRAATGAPDRGTVFVSVANRDKRAMIFPVKRLVDLGFTVLADRGHRRSAAAQRSQQHRGAQAQHRAFGGRRADHRAAHPRRRGRHGGQHAVGAGRSG